jgi:hypothetical protein
MVIALPTCPKCQKFISEKHYERHLRRCGLAREEKHQLLHASSANAQVEGPDQGIPNGPPSEEHGGINWRKVGAVFLIFLLIGSVVVFFVLYALSLL